MGFISALNALLTLLIICFLTYLAVHIFLWRKLDIKEKTKTMLEKIKKPGETYDQALRRLIGVS